jgi:hypothetical protein
VKEAPFSLSPQADVEESNGANAFRKERCFDKRIRDYPGVVQFENARLVTGRVQVGTLPPGPFFGGCPLSFEEEQIASPHYALTRIQKALDTASNDPDPAVRKRALEKVETWERVIAGMSSGQLSVGSRTPVAGTPAWVTLEVTQGGFATGEFLAEGDLLAHETNQLRALSEEVPGRTARARLNHYYLSDQGQVEISKALENGSFSVEVPEEGALPTIVWLLEGGYVLEALSLIETLQPFMERLRFYPRLESKPQPSGQLVRRQTVGEVRAKLSAAGPQPQVSAMREALDIWNPLFDRLLALWLETVEGEIPTLIDGKVVGGWPGNKTPSGWTQRRERWMNDYNEATSSHVLCGKHKHPKSNFGRLAKALQNLQPNTSPQSPRERGWVRRSMANAVAKRGLPNSEPWREVRQEQAQQLSLPTRIQLADKVCQGLADYPEEGGLASVAPFLEDIPGKLKHPLEQKLKMALEAPLEELVAQGVVGSAEVLAQVLPQLTSQVAAAGIEDARLRRVFSQVYSAFKRRRSLLLLNFESQVRLEELPWIKAIDKLRQKNLQTTTVALQTLESVSLLALRNFPHTMVPNPLVSEMATLAKRAGLQLPLVEEVAADIFMGRFSAKWDRAAQLAFGWMEGSFYARYYQLEDPEKRDFAKLCQVRSKEAGDDGSWVASNGAMIEQSQILTTHNLAQLTFGLGLQKDFRGMASELTLKAFSFVVRRQNRPADDFRSRLQMIKNTAYAWRQAIFFLSLASPDEQIAVLNDLQAEIYSQNQDWIARFQPALAGLWYVFQGGRFDQQGIGVDNRQARRFLGWSRGHHWLMPGVARNA